VSSKRAIKCPAARLVGSAVNPLVPDVSAGPVSPLSQTTNTIGVDISGISATVGYSGLAPTLAGLYQINFTVPAGLTAGDNFLDIQGPDSYAAQALISVSTTTAALAPEFVAAPRRFRIAPEVRLTPHYDPPFQPRPRLNAIPVSPYWVRLRPTDPKSR